MNRERRRRENAKTAGDTSGIGKQEKAMNLVPIIPTSGDNATDEPGEDLKRRDYAEWWAARRRYLLAQALGADDGRR